MAPYLNFYFLFFSTINKRVIYGNHVANKRRRFAPSGFQDIPNSLVLFFSLGFPLQRGRLSMPHIPSLGYSFCQDIRLEPFAFYPDKPIEAQITVNHLDTSDKSYVHDASVSWIEDVNSDKFTACVMTAGFNERMSYSNVTVDWLAYQGAPWVG